ncbi:hypothetical protein [Streptomyces sp. NPDC102283]|uniref:hypothetical protein n=1 Tax=Streptomyces sp. NPDC102283 TaxID=3366155 RepID=UPI0037FC1052
MAGQGKTWSNRAHALLGRCAGSVWEALVTHGTLMAGEAVWSQEAVYAAGWPLSPRPAAAVHGSPGRRPADVSVAELEEMLRRE